MGEGTPPCFRRRWPPASSSLATPDRMAGPIPQTLPSSSGVHSHLASTTARLAEFLKNVRGLASSEGSGMGFTPWEQLCWMLGSVLFFHTSEFLLAFAYHGRRVTVGCKIPGLGVRVLRGVAVVELIVIFGFCSFPLQMFCNW